MNESQMHELRFGSVPQLTGMTALVTGGSRGLGREIAMALAAAGASVIIASRKLPDCERVAAIINDSLAEATSPDLETNPSRAVARQLHVGHWQDLEPFVSDLYRTHGTIDILVNNAGISPLYNGLSEVSEELFDKVLDVNLKGPFRLAVLIGERMAQSNGGSIVNISSIAAVNPTPSELPYAAAKAGLNAMTIGLAHALGPSVRVNGIMAGPFLTDITSGWDFEAFNAHAERSIPLRRAGRPAEIAGAVVYLASEMSSYTTGSIMTVDGGSSHPSFSPAPA